MKKLMIAAAIVCATVAAQAATYNWNAQLDGVYDDSPWSDGEVLNAGLATYVFDANGEMTASKLAIALAAGDLTGLGSALNKDAFLGGDYGSINEYGSGILGMGDDTCSAYLVVFNNEDAAKADHFWISEAANGDIDGTVKDGGNAILAFGEQTAGADAWTKIDTVPEPTSGLLLLLGVAGLALRRRRA